MNDIRSEFERFKAFTATAEGFGKIEDEWNSLSNYEKHPSGHGFIKKRASDGDLAGFAIDPLTWEFEIGPQGRHHDDPRINLATRLHAAELSLDKTLERPDPRHRVLGGRMAYMSAWKFPIVFIMGALDVEPRSLQAIEEKLLELGVGLPYTSICRERVFVKKRSIQPPATG